MTSRTEDEELAVIRDWWQRNGKPLLTGGALALIVVFGWQAWQKHQLSEAQGASALYQQLLETSLVANAQPDVSKVAELAGKHEDWSRRGRMLFAPVRTACWPDNFQKLFR